MAGMIHREIYTYAANGHGGDYDDIIEELHARFRVSKRQARNKLAKLTSQYTDRQQRSPGR